MKKVIWFILLILITSSLAACKKKETTDEMNVIDNTEEYVDGSIDTGEYTDNTNEEFVDNNADYFDPSELYEDDTENTDSDIRGESADNNEENTNIVTREDLKDLLLDDDYGVEIPSKDNLDNFIENTTQTKDNNEESNGNQTEQNNSGNSSSNNSGSSKNGSSKSGSNNKSNKTSKSSKTNPTPTPAPKTTSNQYASISLDGSDVLVKVKVNSIKRGEEAKKVLENVKDEEWKSFAEVTNIGYDLVIVNINVTLPKTIPEYPEECIPDIRVRDINGKLINNEAIFVYVGELGSYNNSGLTKTYDVVFEIPENVKQYMLQFGTYGKENYTYSVK